MEEKRMKTTEQLKEQAKKIGLKRWKVHNCSMCDYPCGYIIRGEEVFYDPGCGTNYRPADFDIGINANENRKEDICSECFIKIAEAQNKAIEEIRVNNVS